MIIFWAFTPRPQKPEFLTVHLPKDDKVKLFPGELVVALCLAKSRAPGEFQPGLGNRF